MGMVPSWHMVFALILVVTFGVFCVIYTVAGLIAGNIGTGWWAALFGLPLVGLAGFWIGRNWEGKS